MTNIGNSIQQVLLVTCGKCYIQECNWIGSSPNVFAWKKAAPVSLVKILSSTPPLEAELLNFRDSSFTEIVRQSQVHWDSLAAVIVQYGQFLFFWLL